MTIKSRYSRTTSSSNGALALVCGRVRHTLQLVFFLPTLSTTYLKSRPVDAKAVRIATIRSVFEIFVASQLVIARAVETMTVFRKQAAPVVRRRRLDLGRRRRRAEQKVCRKTAVQNEDICKLFPVFVCGRCMFATLTHRTSKCSSSIILRNVNCVARRRTFVESAAPNSHRIW